MRISIVGAGNTGIALYAHLISKGYEVLLYTRNVDKKKFWDDHDVTAEGIISKQFHIDSTNSIEELLEFSNIVFVTTLANAHKEVFEKIYSVKDANLIILNGNWGAFEASVIKKDFYAKSESVIMESGGMPYISRYEDGHVNISAIKDSIDVSFSNKIKNDEILNIIYDLYRDVNIKESIFETSIAAPNPIIHIPLALFNIIRIEHKEDFNILVDGFSKKAENYILKLDVERGLIAERLGVNYIPILELLNSYWNYDYKTLTDLYTLSPVYSKVKAPKSIEHRFIVEDMPYGIVPISSLGKLLDIETPYADALIAVFNLYFEELICHDVIGFKKELLDII